MADIKEELKEFIKKTDSVELSDFTNSLIFDILDTLSMDKDYDIADNDVDLIHACSEQIYECLEIMNPALSLDIEMLTNLLNLLDSHLDNQ